MSAIDVTLRPGRFCWVDLQAADFDASVAFYRALFGWRVRLVSTPSAERYASAGPGVGTHAALRDPQGGVFVVCEPVASP